MGARLWSQRRSARAASTPPPPSPQPSQTILTPNSFTQSVLYVCEGMSGSVTEAMAAARDRDIRNQSVQHDYDVGYPHQVSLPDGEERRNILPQNMRHLAGPTSDSQAETVREFIRPPPNITILPKDESDHHLHQLQPDFATHGDLGMMHDGAHYPHSYHQYLHLHPHQQQYLNDRQSSSSASLEARFSPYSAVSAGSSSPSSSSGMGFGSGDDSNRGSPRRGRRATGLFGYVAQLTSSRNERTPASSHEGVRRPHRHQGGGLGTGTLLSPSDPYCSTTTTLSEIRSVPCGPSHSPSYPGGLGPSQGTPLDGSNIGVQDLPLSYEQSSQSGCSISADQDHPPLYSEVGENPILYRSVSRPSEERTNSGKI